MADIIVVDDETDVAFMIADYLQAKGYRIRMASGGAELREAIAAAKADLSFSTSTCRARTALAWPAGCVNITTPASLCSTGADLVFDKVAGLEIGADDYLAKPFSPVELEARIAAVLRRRMPKGSNDADALPAGQFAFGTYLFDARARNLIDADGVAIPLTPMELDLVAAFATRAGQVIGRDELLDLAPPRGDEPFDRSIDSRITRLRRRLEKDPAKPELIKTIRGVGYLFPRR